MKCLFSFLLIFSILFFSSSVNLWGAVSSKPIVITGEVVSAHSAAPIANVNISVEGTRWGCASNKAGIFVIKVDSLPVTLSFSHIAFERKNVRVTRPQVGIIQLVPAVLMGEEILVSATQAVPGKTPVAFTDLNRMQIEQLYYHQDVPLVLSDLPGVYAYSDAGNGVGYSYLKIRGFQQSQLGVLLNGIPLNDPEEHAVYWVDHGDILASSSSIQVQRGVGNSLYGTSVFGGTVNVVTNTSSLPRGTTLNLGYGNYMEKGLDLPSQKIAFSYNGSLPKNLSLYLRLSHLTSAGYRQSSGTDQNSLHLSLEQSLKNRLTRLEVLLGVENTGFAWEGIAPVYGYNLKNRQQRRYNFYADPEYNGGLTNANKDVFRQGLFSLQHSRIINHVLLNLTLYAVQGNGYYEQFKGKRDVEEYNLVSLFPDVVHKVDLIRQKWLQNGYWGTLYQITLPLKSCQLTLGGDMRIYEAAHFGRVKKVLKEYLPNDSTISQSTFPPANHKYYQTDREKKSISFYVHSYFDLTPRLGLMFDGRYLGHRYSYIQRRLGVYTQGYRFKLKYDFWDPHIGVNYRLTDYCSIFSNISTAHREPTDDDIYKQDSPEDVPKLTHLEREYAEPLVKPEYLIDYEAGLKFDLPATKLQINLYRMDFRDELIPVEYRYYDADQVFHANIDRTVHQGVELSFTQRWRWLLWDANLSYADNHFVNFQADSIGWSGWGPIADYSGKVIPAYPTWQAKSRLSLKLADNELWLQTIYTGKQYIDFANTSAAAIKPVTLVNVGLNYHLPLKKYFKATLAFRINNLFDKLYETFGYNYYEDWDDHLQRIDLYWPAATRNYYLSLVVNF